MSAILSACALTLFRGQLKKKTQDKFHPNQIKTGNEIVSNFDTKNYCMLFAQMQSGKTATALYTGFTMLAKGMVSNIVIFSGCQDLFLQNLWEKSKMELSQDYEKFVKESTDNDLDIVGFFRERTTVVWRQHIKKQKSLFKDNTLIIWDESHYGSTQKQTIDKELSELLGDAFRGDTTTLKENNIFVLTVTATRCAEQSRHYYNSIARENWSETYLEPGEGYFGVKDNCSLCATGENSHKDAVKAKDCFPNHSMRNPTPGSNEVEDSTNNLPLIVGLGGGLVALLLAVLIVLVIILMKN